jgi:hypothetical protein
VTSILLYLCTYKCIVPRDNPNGLWGITGLLQQCYSIGGGVLSTIDAQAVGVGGHSSKACEEEGLDEARS